MYLLESGVLSVDTLKAVVPLTLKKKEYVDLNMKIIDRAVRFFQEKS